MAIYYLTVAMAGLPLGFVIFIWGMDKGNKDWLFSGAAVIAVSVIIWIRSLSLAAKELKEDKEEKARQFQALLDAINGLRR